MNQTRPAMKFYLVEGTVKREVLEPEFWAAWGGPDVRHELGAAPVVTETIDLPDFEADLKEDLRP